MNRQALRQSSRSIPRYSLSELAATHDSGVTTRHGSGVRLPITWLTRHSEMADAELQLITGHARRETLAVYQHNALDGDLEKKYQETMRDMEL